MVDKNAALNITSFETLVEFLAEQLDWPIDLDLFENIELLGYAWSPQELGLKEEHAGKIREIKQLRPVGDEPWGIFWIDFEPRRLHLTALRKILSRFVTKKRTQIKDHATWKTEDLLFITGQGEDRQKGITFAHFYRDEDGKDVIRDFSWDQTETHFHYLAGDYLESLRWPDPGVDKNEWRQRWLKAFSGSTRQAIRTSKQLAEIMAVRARDMRRRVGDVFEVEAEDGPLHALYDSFKKVLIHDLDPSSFADMYAQTITYGLFSARCMDTDGHFELGEVIERIPETNPFLKDLFSACFKAAEGDGSSIDLDELGVNRLIELLDSLNEAEGDQMQRILEEWGRQTGGEDPVIHFYEGFLKAYAPEQKVQRGVFYTPDPVVSFIVRSVDKVLKEEFNLSLGLADTTTWGELVENGTIKRPKGMHHNSEEWKELSKQPFVQILDPAVGTGTFLKHIIELVHQTMTEKWRSEDNPTKLWNEYVAKDLLPRLNGFEIMMTPYAVCHMKLGLVLKQTGYEFEHGQRLNVFLTNSLDAPHKFSGLPLFSEFIAHESEQANRIKTDIPIAVVIGNPPYAGRSWNLEPEHRALVKKYKYVDSEKIREKGALQLEKSIQEDYVKFFRISESFIEQNNYGVIGLITSHGFLDNPTLRGLRWHLLSTFGTLRFVDLHGNVSRGEATPSGKKDENVFDIKKTGTCVSVNSRPFETAKSRILHEDVWGERDLHKYPWLMAHTADDDTLSNLNPSAPLYLFVPQDEKLRSEYETGYPIDSAIPLHSKGIVTGRDHFVIDFDVEPLIQRMRDFGDLTRSDEEIVEKFNLNPTPWWNVTEARKKIARENDLTQFVDLILYRPFDFRYCFFHPAVLMSPRRPVMANFDGPRHNFLIVTSRMTKGESFAHFTVSNRPTEAIMLSSKTSNNAIIFPLYIYPDQQLGHHSLEDEPSPSFTPEFLRIVEETLNMRALKKGSGDFNETVGPEDLLYYLMAVFHSPTYRDRYSEFLKRDFPRIYLTPISELFSALVRLGHDLVAYHLLEAANLNKPNSTRLGSSPFEVEKASFSDNTIWIDRAKTRGFKGVPKEVWNFHLGGYQVCEKWLKDRQDKGGKNPRPGRVLTDKDIDHYQKIIVAISETNRIMGEIDEVIDEHGGWPDAFVTETAEDS